MPRARAAGADPEAPVPSAAGGRGAGGGGRWQLWAVPGPAPGPRVGLWRDLEQRRTAERGGEVGGARTLEMADLGLQRTSQFKPWCGFIFKRPSWTRRLQTS